MSASYESNVTVDAMRRMVERDGAQRLVTKRTVTPYRKATRSQGSTVRRTVDTSIVHPFKHAFAAGHEQPRQPERWGVIAGKVIPRQPMPIGKSAGDTGWVYNGTTCG